MMWSDYSLAGTLEMARVTTLPIEKAARVSPGQGISAMQIITALEQDVLVPYQKRQFEEFKSGLELIQSDRGGMVYQPLTGLHTDVAQIDFISMYPAIIILGNISPEVPLPDGLTPAHENLGVVPLTLKPLYEKRVAIKLKIRSYPENHPMVKTLKERATALKWLLVVCFGFLGYKMPVMDVLKRTKPSPEVDARYCCAPKRLPKKKALRFCTCMWTLCG